jgi:hypothetical protein
MKKKYEAPQVEKIAFDYSETVVASASDTMERLTDRKFQCSETRTGEIWNFAPGTVGACIQIN